MLVAVPRTSGWSPVNVSPMRATLRRSELRGLGSDAPAASCNIFDCLTWTAVGVGAGTLLALVGAMVVGHLRKKGART